MFFKQAFDKQLDKQLDHWISDLRENADIPVQLRLWNGMEYALGRFERPAVTLTVREAAALPFLLTPSTDNRAKPTSRKRSTSTASWPTSSRSATSCPRRRPGAPAALAKVAHHFTHSKQEDKASIQYHYDVSNDFYKLWLDPGMVYSCAYFERGDEDLATAQLQKIDHILTKIRLQPGQTLLDIGCGWGALVLRAAQKFGARCVGITLSQNQFDPPRSASRQQARRTASRSACRTTATSGHLRPHHQRRHVRARR